MGLFRHLAEIASRQALGVSRCQGDEIRVLAAEVPLPGRRAVAYSLTFWHYAAEQGRDRLKARGYYRQGHKRLQIVHRTNLALFL